MKKTIAVFCAGLFVALGSVFLYQAVEKKQTQTKNAQELASVALNTDDSGQPSIDYVKDEEVALQEKVEKEEEKEVVESDEKKNEESKISLSGKSTDSGVKLSWSVQNLSEFDGFKLVKSENSNPVYPGDDYVYLSEISKRSYDWSVVDGKKYHFRVCKYAGGKCVLYSNDVYLETPEKKSSQKDESSDGKDYASNVSLTIKKDGDSAKLSWSISGGSAPLGFKVVKSKNQNPEYPTRSGDEYHYLSESDARSHTWSGFSSGKTYHFRVCVYKGGSCGKYSNDVEVTF